MSTPIKITTTFLSYCHDHPTVAFPPGTVVLLHGEKIYCDLCAKRIEADEKQSPTPESE